VRRGRVLCSKYSCFTATHCNTLQHAATHRSITVRTELALSYLVEIRRSHCKTLQNTATRCNTLQHTCPDRARALYEIWPSPCKTLQDPATHCTVPVRTERELFFEIWPSHCNTKQQTTAHCNTPQHTSTYHNTLQHICLDRVRVFLSNMTESLHLIATKYSTPQHATELCNTPFQTGRELSLKYGGVTTTPCNTLQHTETHCNTLHCACSDRARTFFEIWRSHCNTLQHTTAHCNTQQHTTTRYKTPVRTERELALKNMAGSLQHPATPQQTATHYTTL